MSCYVVLQSVELFSSVSSRGKENNTVISSIPKSHPTPSFLVHNGLELFLRNVGSRVDSASVTENNRWTPTHLGQTGEVIFGIHLKSDQKGLELNTFLDVELRHKDHAT